MRYVFISLAIGLMMSLSGCMSDNYDYVSSFQPDYYNNSGLQFGYTAGQKDHQLRDLSGFRTRQLRP